MDTQPLAGLLADALAAPGIEPITLSLATTTIDSPIQTASVQPVADRLNALGSSHLTFAASGVSLTPSRQQVVSWFLPVQDAQGNLGLAPQKEAVRSYLDKAGSVDTAKSIDPVVSTLAALASVPPTAAVTIPVTAKVGPQGRAETVPGEYTLDRFPGKYVEVSLAEQKLYQIDGGTLVQTYLISSGKASTPTPTGQFYIGTKAPRALSSLYGLYMPWWESFLNNTYGLHELPEWPNGYKEGEGHLGIPVSDGCVRLGIGAAKALYDWTETGTPVYIH